jgi:transposase IS200 family protein
MDAQHTKHVTYKLAYHFVWCPKDRKKILVGKLALFLEQEIRRIGTGITGKEKHSLFRGRSPFLFLLLYVVQNILTMEPPDIAHFKTGNFSPLG